jgi:nitroreductase
MPTNAPLNDDALNQLFREARTYNGYLDKPVSEAQLDSIWDLMKYGPTSANCLPARLVWCTSDDAKQKLAALAMPANAEKILKAPVTVIIGMDMEFFELLPELFPHADARSRLHSATAACKALISSWRRGRWASIPAPCRALTMRRSMRHFSAARR